MESGELRAILAELKDRLSNLYGDRLVDLILYGSQARGDAEEVSDIDVLVVLRGEFNLWEEMTHVGDFVYELGYEHDVVVSCMFIDDKTYAKGEGPFVRNVRREGITL